MIRENPISQGASAVLFAHIGCLATHFAGLETVLVASIQNMRSVDSTKEKNVELDKCHGYGQLVDEFVKNVKSHFKLPKQDQEALGKLKSRLTAAGKRRNDILHSAWWAQKDGKATQRRVRKKDQNLLKHVEYANIPLQNLESDIYELIDLHTEIPFLLERLEDEN
jgi:hypothetical protein